MNESLAEEIRSVRFPSVRLREGYDMAEVDWFLDQLEAKVRAGEAIDAFVAAAQFRTVRMREAYEMSDVDRFLARAVEQSLQPQPPPLPPEPPSAIDEVQSPLRRLFGRRKG